MKITDEMRVFAQAAAKKAFSKHYILKGNFALPDAVNAALESVAADMEARARREVMGETAKRIYEIGSMMVRIDGDRDHMNASDLLAENSAAIGKELIMIAGKLGFDEAAHWNATASRAAAPATESRDG